MNVFFTCKNTLVILLQLYRLYVVHSEHSKKQSDVELTNISIISKGEMFAAPRKSRRQRRKVADFEDDLEAADDEGARIQK